MSKMIRDKRELPEWFDIRLYEQWEDKAPYEAAQAVDDRLDGARLIEANISSFTAETKEEALKFLAESASAPFRRYGVELFISIFHTETRIRYGEESATSRQQEDDEMWEVDRTARREAQRILKDVRTAEGGEISPVSLWDVVHWMEENQAILDEVETTAQRLAQEHGWNIDEVRNSLQGNIPLWGVDGSDFVVLNDHPSIPAVLKKVERHLTSHPIRFSEDTSARFSDVRKLFEYRIAAYADLMAWSCLTGCKITKKCMAHALFPDGRFGELDMMPSRTVGRFIKRLEEGYMMDILAKSAEMETMQS